MLNQFFVFLFCLGMAGVAHADIDSSYRVLVKCDPTGLLAAKSDFGSAVIQQEFPITVRRSEDGNGYEGKFSGDKAAALARILDFSSRIQDVKSCEDAEAAFSLLEKALRSIGVDPDAEFKAADEDLQRSARAFVNAYSN